MNATFFLYLLWTLHLYITGACLLILLIFAVLPVAAVIIGNYKFS